MKKLFIIAIAVTAQFVADAMPYDQEHCRNIRDQYQQRKDAISLYSYSLRLDKERCRDLILYYQTLNEQGRRDFENDNRWLDTIPSKTFQCSVTVTDIVIPGTIRTLEEECFRYSNLRSVKIPKSVETLWNRCFADCLYLRVI
jgi:hypothetical protein